MRHRDQPRRRHSAFLRRSLPSPLRAGPATMRSNRWPGRACKNKYYGKIRNRPIDDNTLKNVGESTLPCQPNPEGRIPVGSGDTRWRKRQCRQTGSGIIVRFFDFAASSEKKQYCKLQPRRLGSVHPEFFIDVPRFSPAPFFQRLPGEETRCCPGGVGRGTGIGRGPAIARFRPGRCSPDRPSAIADGRLFWRWARKVPVVPVPPRRRKDHQTLI